MAELIGLVIAVLWAATLSCISVGALAWSLRFAVHAIRWRKGGK